MSFGPYLRRLARGYAGTKGQLARASGITAWHFSRLLSGGRPALETILRLAAETETSAAEALTAAGRRDIADLLERLYGDANPQPSADLQLTPEERRVIEAWRGQNRRLKRAYLALLEGTAARVDGQATPPRGETVLGVH